MYNIFMKLHQWISSVSGHILIFYLFIEISIRIRFMLCKQNVISYYYHLSIFNYLLYDDLSRSSLLNLPISKDSFGIIYECCKLLVHVATLRQRQTLCTYVLIDVRAKFIPCPVKSKFAKTYLVIHVLYWFITISNSSALITKQW